MANPNITAVTSIFGVTSAVALSALPATATIVDNPAGSNAVYKINALYVSNVGISANNASIIFNRPNAGPRSPEFFIVRRVTVPQQSTLDVVSKSIYLMENDSLRGATLSADGGAGMMAVCSFEIIR